MSSSLLKMYIPNFLVIIFFVSIILLWDKIRDKIRNLERQLKINNISTRFSLIVKDKFFNISIIRELAGVNKQNLSTPFKDLENKERKKLHELVNKLGPLLNIGFRFFYDKELVFFNGSNQSWFSSIPTENDYLYSTLLGETLDEMEIHFLIKLRWRRDIIEGKTTPVYVGYLKKHRILSSNKDKLIVLFEIPQIFLDPDFISNRNNGEQVAFLTKTFKLKHIESRDFDTFRNDFGDVEFFTGMPDYYDSEYFEIFFDFDGLFIDH